MVQTTNEMPHGMMEEPKTTPSAPSAPNMGDVFRATATQSAQQQTAPSVQAETMPGEEDAHEESGDTTGRMPGE